MLQGNQSAITAALNSEDIILEPTHMLQKRRSFRLVTTQNHLRLNHLFHTLVVGSNEDGLHETSPNEWLKRLHLHNVLQSLLIKNKTKKHLVTIFKHQADNFFHISENPLFINLTLLTPRERAASLLRFCVIKIGVSVSRLQILFSNLPMSHYNLWYRCGSRQLII